MTDAATSDDDLRPHDALVHRRLHSPLERLADATVHVAGIAAGLIGAAVLVALAFTRGDAGELAAVSIYGLGLVAMLGASAAYNMLYYTRFRAVLRRMDHSAIFLMIAGTYTPLTTQVVTGLLALLSTAAIWATAAAGVVVKFASPRLFERIGVGVYLVLGWIGIGALAPFVLHLPAEALWALLAGGILYSAGVVFHIWETLPGQNAIWHGFVLAGASCHWVAILQGVVLKG